nr:MAG: hypothetical protein [Salisharnavirus sp.]
MYIANHLNKIPTCLTTTPLSEIDTVETSVEQQTHHHRTSDALNLELLADVISELEKEKRARIETFAKKFIKRKRGRAGRKRRAKKPHFSTLQPHADVAPPAADVRVPRPVRAGRRRNTRPGRGLPQRPRTINHRHTHVHTRTVDATNTTPREDFDVTNPLHTAGMIIEPVPAAVEAVVETVPEDDEWSDEEDPRPNGANIAPDPPAVVQLLQNPPQVVSPTTGPEPTPDEMVKIIEAAPAKLPPIAEDDDKWNKMFEYLKTPTWLSKELTTQNEWLSHLENIVLVGYSIYRSRNLMDIIVAIASYIKMESQASLVGQVCELIDLVKGKDVANIVPHGLDTISVMTKWELFKTNTAFAKISYLMTAAMALPICKRKNIEWSPGGIEVIALKAAEQQVKAFDVVDALIVTFNWISEVGAKCIEEKSLTPALYTDLSTRQLTTDIETIVATHVGVINGNEGDLGEFDRRVDDAIKRIATMKAGLNKGATAIWLQNKYAELVFIREKIVARNQGTSFRFQPLGISITGSSSVGKSTLARISTRIALNAMGYKWDAKRNVVCERLRGEAFDSNVWNDILSLQVDDACNGKPDFCKTSPSDLFLTLLNSVAAQALKAESNQKGIIFFNFKVGCSTSNHKTMNMEQYTDKPEAVLRRFIHVRPRIKPEYCIPGSVCLNKEHPNIIKDPNIVKDVWTIDVEEIYIYEHAPGKDAYCFRPYQYTDDKGTVHTCTNMNLHEYLQCMVHYSKVWYKQQTALVKSVEDFDNETWCQNCHMPPQYCSCAKFNCPIVSPHGLVASIGASLLKDALAASWNGYKDIVCSAFVPTSLSTVPTAALAKKLENHVTYITAPIITGGIPPFLKRNRLYKRVEEGLSKLIWNFEEEPEDWFLLPFWYMDQLCMKVVFKIQKPLLTICKVIPSIAVIDTLLWITGDGCTTKYIKRIEKYAYVEFFILPLAGVCGIVSTARRNDQLRRYRALENEYLTRTDALSVKAQEMHTPSFTSKWLGTGMVALAVGIRIFKMFNDSRPRVEPAGLEVVDVENTPSWFGHLIHKMGFRVGTQESSTTSSSSDIVSTFRKSNLFFAEIEFKPGVVKRCNIFFPQKYIAWLPEHMFHEAFDMSKPAVFPATVTVQRDSSPGGTFKFVIDDASSVKMEGLDIRVCYVPLCVSMADKTKWLPTTKPVGTAVCKLLIRDGYTWNEESSTATCENTGHSKAKFYGASYTTTKAKNGSCMGIVVSMTKPCAILGFHAGGDTRVNYGVCQTVLLSDAIEAKKRLELLTGVCISASDTTIPKTQMGRQVVDSANVHPHCLIATMDDSASIEVLGSTKLRTVQKSTVRPSPISELVAEHCGVPNAWGPPKLDPNWKAYNATLEHVVNSPLPFAPALLEKACQDWIAPLRERATHWKASSLSDHETVNGIPGQRFVDGLNMKTSMGFPIFGSKKKYFSGIPGAYVPDAITLKEVERCRQAWIRGERAYPVFSATLKDEPTLLSKDKVRVFQAAPIALSLQIRKYYLPIVRFLCCHPVLSEMAVGINCFSRQWQEVMDHATAFGVDDDQVLALDYKKFDVRMLSQLILRTLYMLIELAEIMGYPENELHEMRMMSSDIAHPVVDWNGTLIITYNMNPSGSNLTVIINSIVGALYLRMGFFHIYPEETNFRDHVAAITYGDDMIGSVKITHRKFNFKTYKEFLNKHGIDITPPDKESEGDCFLEAEDADFLKRESNYIPEIDCIIGKLDEMSIFKSLHCNMKSKTETPEQIACACMETALHEWFAHGREVYELRRAQLHKIASVSGLSPPGLKLSFDDRVHHWKQKYNSDETEDLPLSSNSFAHIQPHGLEVVCVKQKPNPVNNVGVLTPPVLESLDNSCCLSEKAEVGGLPAPHVVPHSAYTTSENVVFVDKEEQESVSIPSSMDATRMAGVQPALSLDAFFSRPIDIYTAQWGTGTLLNQTFDPWTRYLTDQRVIEKLNNWKMLSCTLHLKFIINGNAFHYGRVLVAYTPYYQKDAFAVGLVTQEDMVLLTQRPHLFLNPTISQGGTMTLPFFYQKNMLDLISIQNFADLGVIQLYSVQGLKHANGASDSVTIKVFAWATDVTFTTPTTYTLGSIEPQGELVVEPHSDEYGTGPVSKPSSSIANISSKLVDVPVIGPYAKATEMAARATSALATNFGYSAPVAFANTCARPVSKSNFSVCDMPDDIIKLSMTAKQEVTIDPRTTGIGTEDELTINSIATRSSYLFSFDWSPSTVPETQLASIVVDPGVYRTSGLNLYLPACSYASLPFRDWRGSMEYRFMVVCSGYHKGRLKIVYDPVAAPGAPTPYNAAWTTIVDITESTDFTVKVGWSANTSYRNRVPIRNGTTLLQDTTYFRTDTSNLPYNSITQQTGNGVLSVFVVNELTVPNTTIDNSISVNVFVKACDDFEVAVPDAHNVHWISPNVEPQGEEVLLDVDGPTVNTFDHSSDIYYGEVVRSFRPLLKRYTIHELLLNKTQVLAGTSALVTVTRQQIPRRPGYTNYPLPDSPDTTQGGWNYVMPNLFSYLRDAFVGYRGGIRWVISMPGTGVSHAWIGHSTGSSGPGPGTEVVDLDNYPFLQIPDMYKALAEISKTSYTYVNVKDNCLIQAEVPHQSTNRFNICRRNSENAERRTQWKLVYITEQGYFGSDIIDSVPLITQFATAEDFNFFFYIGPPRLRFQGLFPTTVLPN